MCGPVLHLLVDVLVSSSFGYRLRAVSKWAMDVEDPLSTVTLETTSLNMAFTHLFLAQYRSNMDLFAGYLTIVWRQMCDSDKTLAKVSIYNFFFLG
jgi:hypothetical protein